MIDETSRPLTVAAASLVDTHCHLTLEQLGQAPDDYWRRAQSAGVYQAVVIGIDVDSSRGVVDFIDGHEQLFGAVGIHPNQSGEAKADDMDRIRELAQHQKVVAVGESGLDLYWDRAPLATQERWLDAHVELALDLDLPLVLHIRDAYAQAARRLESAAAQGLRGIIHCFAGEADEADPFIEWGWPISFSGILTYSGANAVREAARRTPLDQCLVETDSPWLTPAERKGEVNEPAFVVHVAQRLGQVKQIAEVAICVQTSANARRVLDLPSIPESLQNPEGSVQKERPRFGG